MLPRDPWRSFLESVPFFHHEKWGDSTNKDVGIESTTPANGGFTTNWGFSIPFTKLDTAVPMFL